MYRILIALMIMLTLSFSQTTLARQSEDLKGVCEMAGGTWTGHESGNWACCWADWGCYGCHGGICKMQCRTKRCRDANRVRKTTQGTKAVKGLVAPGQKAPVAPMK